MANVKLRHFELSTLVGPVNQFYANGRQQIRVNITIQKQKRESEQSPWNDTALSPTELASLTLVDISTNPNATALPQGWSVDTDPNVFFTGPFVFSEADASHETGGDEEVETPQTPAGEPREPQEVGARSLPEVHRRFVRSTRVGPEELMARVKLDGGPVVTTNIATDPHFFRSTVVLNATTPFSLPLNQLTLRNEVLLDTTSNSVRQKVVGYFWAIPPGLAIYSNTTLTPSKNNLFFIRNTSTGRACRGRSYSAPAFNSPPEKMLVKTDDGFVYPNRPSAVSYVISLARGQISADLLTLENTQQLPESSYPGGVYEIIDMYGNEHHFRVDPSSDYSTLTINYAPRSLASSEPSGAAAASEDKERS